MDYHILLIDYQTRLQWVCKVGDHYELPTRKKKGGLLKAICKRVYGEPAFLNDISEVRRSIMRFDERVGIVVYHVRLSRELNEQTKEDWKNSLTKAAFWIRFEPGHVVGSTQWEEYMATPEEREHMLDKSLTWGILLKWPIMDPICLSFIHDVTGPSSSTSGPVVAGAGTAVESPIGHGTIPMEIDPPHNDTEMESPVPAPFSPFPEPSSVVPSVLPSAGDLTGLDRSTDASRCCHVSFPEVDRSSSILEASVVHLDPRSAEQVLSVQIQSHDILAVDGMISLRPTQLIEGKEGTANTTHYTLDVFQRGKSLDLGRRGGISRAETAIPQCTFTQTVTLHAGSPFILIIHDDPVLDDKGEPSLDAGGIELCYYWLDRPREPPFSRMGASTWPPSLSGETIEALSGFPQSFHRSLNPKPIHGVDIAGDGLGRSVFQTLVSLNNVWNRLPYQLSNGLRVLAERVDFDAYNDADASLVPLAHVNRPHLLHGMIQSAAGVPLAQYHLAGSRRIWIAVGAVHRDKLVQALPSTIPRCFWRHGEFFFRPEYLRDLKVPFTLYVQNPGEVVLIGGSTLYESYDEGSNVILSVPYLDQRSMEIIAEQRLIPSETCDCRNDSSRDRVVEKRALVLQGSGSVVDRPLDHIDALFHSNSPLTDADDAMDISEGPSIPSIAMDGPCAENFSSLEPVGDIVLQDYVKRGVRIANLDQLLSDHPNQLVGEVPRILVDMRSEDLVTETRLATQRLAEEYGGVIFQQSPSLSDEWSEDNSMDTLRAEFGKVSKKRKSTLGRLDAEDGDATPIQQQIIHNSLYPLGSSKVRWKQADSAALDLDGLYVLKRSEGLQVLADDHSGRTPFEQCWDWIADPVANIPSVYPGDVLSPLPENIRSQLESLPTDLSVWTRETSTPYCAGIGANTDEEHVLKLTTHPLQDALAHLPQALMMLALHSHALGRKVEDLDLEAFQTIHSIANEAASGTLFPWGYGGHYRTVFGIHFEDAWMPSANLHVAGAPKMWLFIRKDDFKRLSKLLSPVLSSCFTYHRSLFIHPKFLIRNRIRFTVARQTTGDMIIAGSTSAHLGWNVGPNLAVAANFLDSFSIDIILREVMNETEAPWPCACGLNPVPPEALAPGTLMNLPLHDYMHKSVSDVGSTVFEWIYGARRYIRKSKDFLQTDTGRFAQAWRYLHLQGEYAEKE